MAPLDLTDMEDLRETAGSYLHFLLGGLDTDQRGFLGMRNVITVLASENCQTVEDAVTSLSEAGVSRWASSVAFIMPAEVQDALTWHANYITIYFFAAPGQFSQRSRHRRALMDAEELYFPDDEFGAFSRLALNVGPAGPRPMAYILFLDDVDRAFLAWWTDPDDRELWQEYVHFDRIRKAQYYDPMQRGLRAWHTASKRERAARTIQHAAVEWGLRPGGPLARLGKRRFEQVS